MLAQHENWTTELITDLNNDDWNRLFDESYPELERGTWDWRFSFRALTEPAGAKDAEPFESKKESFRAYCQRIMDLSESNYGVLVKKDGYALMYGLIVTDTQNSGRARILITLTAEEPGAGRSWLYDANHKTVILYTLRDALFFREHVVEVIKDSPSYHHHISANTATAVYTTPYGEESTDRKVEAIFSDVEVAHFLMTYPEAP